MDDRRVLSGILFVNRNGLRWRDVPTLKRDYVRVNPTPDARTVIEQLPAWLTQYNEVHPHKALGYRSPRD